MRSTPTIFAIGDGGRARLAGTGADVRGVDLSRVTEAEAEALYAALLEYQVLFFRDQALTPLDQVALGRQFGELGPLHPPLWCIPRATMLWCSTGSPASVLMRRSGTAT